LEPPDQPSGPNGNGPKTKTHSKPKYDYKNTQTQQKKLQKEQPPNQEVEEVNLEEYREWLREYGNCRRVKAFGCHRVSFYKQHFEVGSFW